jgi:hypothetical protein
VNTTLWTAPVAVALDGADLSLVAGALIAVVAYVALWSVGNRSVVPTTVEGPRHAVPEPSAGA